MLLNFFSIEDFKDSFPYAALGARVCYNSGDLNSLLNDPRVVEKQKRAEFLSKLGNYRHFSVFAHSFVYKKVGEENALRIGATYFKTRYNPKYPDVIGVSLRHYLEELSKTDENEYLKAFEKLAEYDTPVSPIEIRTEDNLMVALIGLNREYDGYAVFFIDGISRATTHQLVRHTALNFSQRSQRYVKEDENYTVIPPSIAEDKDALKLIRLYNDLSVCIYNALVYGYKVKREDARFFLPTGRRTTIVVSGTLNWINDFIEKRNTPHAQWEIRKVAKLMKEILDSQII
ncbi:MAG: FAD-dependent thymidylate synthase [Sulfurihydrogenibium sp.]|jgi:thymidylate synthase (FAD)|nr:FAD-dependent thymidylate synthase [Sulfurihydrogenibium sp.]